MENTELINGAPILAAQCAWPVAPFLGFIAAFEHQQMCPSIAA